MTSPHTTLLKDDALERRFDELTSALRRWTTLWRPSPFTEASPSWVETHPALTRDLLKLTPEAVQAINADMDAHAALLTPHLPELAAIPALTRLAPFEARPTGVTIGARLLRHVPGRKEAQTRAFAETLWPSEHPFVEWCSGQGHLGRLLSLSHQKPTRCLEIDERLCRIGRGLAAELRAPVKLTPMDVMTPHAAQALDDATHAVALHACGHLHHRLIELTVARQVPAFALAPCCFHMHAPDPYEPLSQRAAQAGLTLSRDDIRMALRHFVTGKRRDWRDNQKSMAWRLAYDLLQRDLRGQSATYRRLPSIPRSALRGSFEDALRALAARDDLAIPDTVTLDAYEARGAQRRDRAQAFQLVRHFFRRPIELWLVLDRALALREADYEVTVATFCDFSLTPRNLMIQARRPRHTT